MSIEAEVLEERQRQIAKWGTEPDLIEESGSFARYLLVKISVLGEEFGEVCMARNDKDIENMRVELVQVAAVCFAMIEGIDWRDGRS